MSAPRPAAHVPLVGGPRRAMPRFRIVTEGVSAGAPEFDLCSRCAADGDIVRTVVTGKLGVPVPPGGPTPVTIVAHRSYDFQPRPVPCLSCARVLSSEDD